MYIAQNYAFFIAVSLQCANTVPDQKIHRRKINKLLRIYFSMICDKSVVLFHLTFCFIKAQWAAMQASRNSKVLHALSN